ncbi:hypothetical protein DVH24_000131 [Malus domestica]|uniref:Uncharacterized protein n=1 Tax=Malus domestica TaxID=3750 RepID=A0A498J3Q1_MALDO|nr:hypothetical protein DVH24_000131 [Malus domestica]
MNLDYFHLVEDMDKFNSYSWSPLNNFKTAFLLLLIGEEEEEWMGYEKEEAEGMGSKRRQISGWGCKMFSYVFEPLRYCKMTDMATILRLLQWSRMKKQLIHEQLQRRRTNE